VKTCFTSISVEKRKGFKITQEMRDLYAVLPPDKWATAMRRDEFCRPIKKQTTVRIDADVLEWLKSRGAGDISRVN
jgi:uncharacterized protein (DUF4415 family)